MKRVMAVCLVSALGALWIGSTVLAKGHVGGGVLDGKSFTGQMGKKGQTQGDKDTFIFKEGMFRSTACDPYGFKPASYSSAQSGEKVIFKADAFSPTEGGMKWNGTVQGNEIKGTAVWVKSGKAPVEHWFTGKTEK